MDFGKGILGERWERGMGIFGGAFHGGDAAAWVGALEESAGDMRVGAAFLGGGPATP